MGNGGQHGIAIAAAAHLGDKYRTMPQGIYDLYLPQLQGIVSNIADNNKYSVPKDQINSK